uniref:Dual specificity protein phosphatase DSP8 n=1 Tax=Leersia perrieri TaxID=77586 RepID=A0A0D9WM04_9ORYZ
MAVEAAGRRGAAPARARRKAKEAAVGAMARVLFYPTLLYNVVRSKVQAEFRWWDEVDQFILLGAVPFRRDVPRLQKLGVYGVITLNEPFETLVRYKNMTPSTAFEHVRSKRARVLLTHSQWKVVQEFSKMNAETELPAVTSHSAAVSPAAAGNVVLVTKADLEGSDVTEANITEHAGLSSHKSTPLKPMTNMLSCLFPSLKVSGDSSLANKVS